MRGRGNDGTEAESAYSSVPAALETLLITPGKPSHQTAAKQRGRKIIKKNPEKECEKAGRRQKWKTMLEERRSRRHPGADILAHHNGCEWKPLKDPDETSATKKWEK